MTAEELSALRDVLMDSDEDVLQGERVDNMMLDVSACGLGAHVRASVRVYVHINIYFLSLCAGLPLRVCACSCVCMGE